VTVNTELEGCSSAFCCQDREKSRLTLAMMDSVGGTNRRPSECHIIPIFINVSINHCVLTGGPGTTISPCLNLCLSGISDWLGDKRNMVRVPIGARHFLFSKVSRRALGLAQFPTQGLQRALYPGVRQPGRELDHYCLSSGEVKNARSYTFTSAHTFMA
jgi:hypothetical protein